MVLFLWLLNLNFQSFKTYLNNMHKSIKFTLKNKIFFTNEKESTSFTFLG